MNERLAGLLIIAVWVAAVATFLYSKARRVPYIAALRKCGTWTAIVGGLMLFNFWLADELGMPHGSSGHVRGRSVLSPYGFLVQLLLIVEIGVLLVAKEYLGFHGNYNDKPAPKISSSKVEVGESATASNLSSPVQRPKPESAYEVNRTFGINIVTVFFLSCAIGNFWLGLRALERSLYGLFFVFVAVGLFVAAYRASFTIQIRRK